MKYKDALQSKIDARVGWCVTPGHTLSPNINQMISAQMFSDLIFYDESKARIVQSLTELERQNHIKIQYEIK